MDLGPYLNKSSLSVTHTCPLGRVYELFRCLGLRHMVVTDTTHKTIGIITRKDLMNEYKHNYDPNEEGNNDNLETKYIVKKKPTF